MYQIQVRKSCSCVKEERVQYQPLCTICMGSKYIEEWISLNQLLQGFKVSGTIEYSIQENDTSQNNLEPETRGSL
mgnify:CR=1 FL=1